MSLWELSTAKTPIIGVTHDALRKGCLKKYIQKEEHKGPLSYEEEWPY